MDDLLGGTLNLGVPVRGSVIAENGMNEIEHCLNYYISIRAVIVVGRMVLEADYAQMRSSPCFRQPTRRQPSEPDKLHPDCNSPSSHRSTLNPPRFPLVHSLAKRP